MPQKTHFTNKQKLSYSKEPIFKNFDLAKFQKRYDELTNREKILFKEIIEFLENYKNYDYDFFLILEEDEKAKYNWLKKYQIVKIKSSLLNYFSNSTIRLFGYSDENTKNPLQLDLSIFKAIAKALTLLSDTGSIFIDSKILREILFLKDSEGFLSLSKNIIYIIESNFDSILIAINQKEEKNLKKVINEEKKNMKPIFTIIEFDEVQYQLRIREDEIAIGNCKNNESPAFQVLYKLFIKKKSTVSVSELEGTSKERTMHDILKAFNKTKDLIFIMDTKSVKLKKNVNYSKLKEVIYPF